jgi:predicted SprT family Zn-dependent metalloprotease
MMNEIQFICAHCEQLSVSGFRFNQLMTGSIFPCSKCKKPNEVKRIKALVTVRKMRYREK